MWHSGMGNWLMPASAQDDSRLATILHKANRLTANQYRAIMERAGKTTDKELGLMLINAGYIMQEDILLNLQSHYTDIDPAPVHVGGGILPF